MKVPYAGGKMDPEHFSALSLERQKAISCSYASLLAMNVIHRLEALNGLEKFALYIDYCAEVLDHQSQGTDDRSICLRPRKWLN